jgi:transposase-like protein
MIIPTVSGPGATNPRAGHPPAITSNCGRAAIARCDSPRSGGSFMPKKKFGRGKRYTAAEKSRILKAALAQRLTAAQVQKKFGVSPITFYRWRGPVRKGRRGRPPAAAALGAGLADLRDQVRSGVQRVLPSVIRQEVRSYLDRVLAAGKRRGRRPGRPRKRK